MFNRAPTCCLQRLHCKCIAVPDSSANPRRHKWIDTPAQDRSRVIQLFRRPARRLDSIELGRECLNLANHTG
jgi:hypothetical protein